MKRGDAQRGAATVEFLLITALLLTLFLGALHLGLALHIRNLAQDAAVHGARQATLADSTPSDGRRRAQELANSTLRGATSARVEVGETHQGVGGRVTVKVTATLPVLGFLPGPRLVSAEASSTRVSG